jgi:hypothetical protein
MPNDTPLHKACHKGEVKEVEELLEQGNLRTNVANAANVVLMLTCHGLTKYHIFSLLL